jgi:hypothetical protein
LGGACIARSTNGGHTFSISANDCVHTANFDGYDGSDVAAASTGGVLAVFDNVVRNLTDAWYARTPTAAFTQLPNPFPRKLVNTHPRLFAFAHLIYIVQAVGNAGELWLNYYDTDALAWGSTLSPQAWPMNAVRRAVFSTNIDQAGNLFSGFEETGFQMPCPRGDGYGGDYDVHLAVYQPPGAATPLLGRSFADSTDGTGTSQCLRRWLWTSAPVAVSQVAIPYP